MSPVENGADSLHLAVVLLLLLNLVHLQPFAGETLVLWMKDFSHFCQKVDLKSCGSFHPPFFSGWGVTGMEATWNVLQVCL